MSKVYAIRSDKFDITQAKEYGDIRYMDVSSSPLNPNECIREMKKHIALFNPSEDYICMSGSTLHLTYMLLSALQKFRVVNILVFNSVTRKYICRKAGSDE